MRTFIKSLTLFATFFFLCSTQAQAAQHRLSAAVSFAWETHGIDLWLEQPNTAYSYVEAYVFFLDNLGKDVIFGIDQEFIEGISSPLFIKGGDWMGFVGLQRTGAVWVATGTEDTYKGTPSSERKWEIKKLQHPLKSYTWYRLRTVLDFANRKFVSFTIEGPDYKETIDLRAYMLDYPNYVAFSDRALTSYVFSMRGKSLGGDLKTGSRVYFDDLKTGLLFPDGKETVISFDDFEDEANSLPKQPIPLSAWFGGEIPLKEYQEGQWYLERDEARVKSIPAVFARSGQRVMMCDSTLENISYKKWVSKK